MEQLDVVVIGAGVVGLAVGRALALAGREVMVLEKEQSIGTGVSSRNSEVVHAGLYYAPGSLKARLCVRGKELLYQLCEQRGVSVNACGKLVVATDEAQLPALQALAAQSGANGVPVSLLTASEARALEPALHCVAALHSPTTGIVDSHGLMLALQGDLERAGGMVALESAVVAGQATPEGVVLTVQNAGASAHGCERSSFARVLGGAWHSRLASRACAARALCQGQLLHTGGQSTVHATGVSRAARGLVGCSSDAGFGRTSQVWPRSGMAERCHPRCD